MVLGLTGGYIPLGAYQGKFIIDSGKVSRMKNIENDWEENDTFNLEEFKSKIK
ncbi:hypothetical protein ACSBO6_09715 [Bacillus sp. AL-1R]